MILYHRILYIILLLAIVCTREDDGIQSNISTAVSVAVSVFLAVSSVPENMMVSNDLFLPQYRQNQRIWEYPIVYFYRSIVSTREYDGIPGDEQQYLPQLAQTLN
jgi:hypothetical protein